MEKIEYSDEEIIIYKLKDLKDRYYVAHVYEANKNYYTNMSYIEENIYNKKIKYKQLSIFD